MLDEVKKLLILFVGEGDAELGEHAVEQALCFCFILWCVFGDLLLDGVDQVVGLVVADLGAEFTVGDEFLGGCLLNVFADGLTGGNLVGFHDTGEGAGAADFDRCGDLYVGVVDAGGEDGALISVRGDVVDVVGGHVDTAAFGGVGDHGAGIGAVADLGIRHFAAEILTFFRNVDVDDLSVIFGAKI